jgi:4,5-DOPA dioxygenase extradiol
VPSARYAHPSTEHFAPIFVAMGASEPDVIPVTPITGYYLGLSKRSIQLT